ncbi:MAG: cation:proton antiporter subunit C [Methanocellales archaeon]|nr:cation:proton antiporter subunit C [Methanocellales archaeon]MDI6903455.1 cation:proton antiporter subunit C [Methanocellales archaeon]
MILEFILGNFNYWICTALFLIGFYAMIAKKNLIKKAMGFDIAETSIFLFIISTADVEGGTVPITMGGEVLYANPLPHCLILTAIVVALTTTAVALSMAVKIYEHYGTLDAEKLMEL